MKKKYIVRGFYMNIIGHICNNSTMLNQSGDFKYFDTREEAEKAMFEAPRNGGYLEIVEVYV